MKFVHALAVLALMAAAAGAQQGKTPQAAAVKKSAAPPPARADVKQSAVVPDSLKKAPARMEQEEEEGVMIDDRTEDNNSGRFAESEPQPAAEAEEAAATGGLPSSYGQLKGVLNEGTKNLLVFENEEGVLAFVQVAAGRNAVSWKLISRIVRSAD